MLVVILPNVDLRDFNFILLVFYTAKNFFFAVDQINVNLYVDTY